MESETLRLGWAVEFLDSPAEGLEFRFWSGRGPLTIGTGADAVTYQGSNGVITIDAPTEQSGEAMRLTAVMDATNPDVRNQLRHDIGPLRVRIQWLYYKVGAGLANDGITPFVDRANWWSTSTNVTNYPQTINGLTTQNEVFPVRFRSVGEERNFEVGTTYWVKNTIIYSSQGWATLAFFDTEANATAATGLGQFAQNQTGRINFNDGGDGDGVVFGRFDASEVVEADPSAWVPTGKSFEGRLSAPLLKGSQYIVDIESRISDILRGRVLNWSNDIQQQRHPADKGMEYLIDYAQGISTKWPP